MISYWIPSSRKDITRVSNSMTTTAIKYSIFACWMPRSWSISIRGSNKLPKTCMMNMNMGPPFVYFVGSIIFARIKTMPELFSRTISPNARISWPTSRAYQTLTKISQIERSRFIKEKWTCSRPSPTYLMHLSLTASNIMSYIQNTSKKLLGSNPLKLPIVIF